MKKLLTLLLLLSGSASAQLLQGPSALEAPANAYVNITNSTTNVFYLSHFSLSWTNYAPTSGTVDLWAVRSSFSNLLFRTSFTNVRCVTYYFPSAVLFGRNDGVRWWNGTTNTMKLLYSVGVR